MGKDAKVATKSGITKDLRIGDKIIGGEVFAYLFIGDIEGLSCEKNYLSDFPKERADEILSSKSEKVRRQKTAVWKLLLFAAKEIFGLSANEIRFEKTEKGKWLCDKFWFSLSHTDGAAAVVIAEKPCGTDIEYAPKFFEKAAYKSFIASFLRQIGENDGCGAEEALKLWTEKESVYKLSGDGVFSPKKIDVKNENVVTEVIGDYVLSVATTDKVNKENLKIIVLNNI